MNVDDTRGILFVCTGNICRSPYLEHAFRSTFSGTVAATIPVASAGTAAHDGDSAAPPILDALRSRGLNADGFRSRRLTAEHIATAGLILTATRSHRADVVRLDAGATTRTFTLFQLIRLLSASPDRPDPDPDSGLLPEIIGRALAARGRTRGGEGDDLEDPWRRSRGVYRRVIDRMDAGLVALAASLPATR